MQAIGQKPQVIVLAGMPIAAIQQPLAAAKDAGIIVSDGAITDPLPETGKAGYVATANSKKTYDTIGPVATNWIMADSGCKAHVAAFFPQYDILKYGGQKVQEGMKASCPDCKFDIVDMQNSVVGTPAGLNQIVSAIQADRSIDYVYAPFGAAVGGLAEALRAAGIDGVKIVGALPDATSIKDLQSGDNSMWVLQTSKQAAWALADNVFRTIDSGTPSEQIQPVAILTSENVPKGDIGVPVYPADYQDEWLAKWGVSQ